METLAASTARPKETQPGRTAATEARLFHRTQRTEGNLDFFCARKSLLGCLCLFVSAATNFVSSTLTLIFPCVSHCPALPPPPHSPSGSHAARPRRGAYTECGWRCHGESRLRAGNGDYALHVERPGACSLGRLYSNAFTRTHNHI